MNEIYINVVLPPYLKQWLINTTGGTEPIRFAKGSPYNSFLREYIRHKRECEKFTPWTPDCVRIVVPHFPGKSPEYYNYLSPSAAKAFEEMVRDFFDGELARVVRAFKNIGKCRYHLLTAWLEDHGIEVDDRNTCAVLKRWQLIQSRITATERQKKYRGNKDGNRKKDSFI